MVRANKLESCYLRPLVFYGSREDGRERRRATPVHVAIAAWPWGAYLGEDGLSKGIRVKTSSLHAPPRQHHDVQAKAVGNYANSILANQEALDDGYDEALLLDTQRLRRRGRGREPLHRAATASCLHARPVGGALNGITRDTVIAICAATSAYAVRREAHHARRASTSADEAFFTGTAAEVTPIRELDRRAIGNGSRGPITDKIQSAFFDVVNGRNPEVQADWLTQGLTHEPT